MPGFIYYSYVYPPCYLVTRCHGYQFTYQMIYCRDCLPMYWFAPSLIVYQYQVQQQYSSPRVKIEDIQYGNGLSGCSSRVDLMYYLCDALLIRPRGWFCWCHKQTSSRARTLFTIIYAYTAAARLDNITVSHKQTRSRAHTLFTIIWAYTAAAPLYHSK